MTNDRQDLGPTANAGAVAAFLHQLQALPSPASGPRGRLIFALDATASREPSWDQAMAIQASMFSETAGLGGLSVQLCHYGGFHEFSASPWCQQSPELLARMTRAGHPVVVIAPPYIPYAPAWLAAGVALSQLEIVDASPRDALWAFEQCLRSGACAAVVGWPRQADAQALRRLQVAADSGDCLGFVLRERRHAMNPSPAVLRLEHDGEGWRVRKCRGGPAPTRAFAPGLH